MELRRIHGSSGNSVPCFLESGELTFFFFFFLYIPYKSLCFGKGRKSDPEAVQRGGSLGLLLQPRG